MITSSRYATVSAHKKSIEVVLRILASGYKPECEVIFVAHQLYCDDDKVMMGDSDKFLERYINHIEEKPWNM